MCTPLCAESGFGRWMPPVLVRGLTGPHPPPHRRVPSLPSCYKDERMSARPGFHSMAPSSPLAAPCHPANSSPAPGGPRRPVPSLLAHAPQELLALQGRALAPAGTCPPR